MSAHKSEAGVCWLFAVMVLGDQVFRRLVNESRAALTAPDPASGEAALIEMIDLSCELRDYDYFRSQDPVEAAAVVVSDEVAVLWRHVLEDRGFAAFAAMAAGQLIRWESRFGWTRSGWGAVSGRERQLADVVADFLTVPDTWVTFSEQYLQVLDGVAPPPGTSAPPPASASTTARKWATSNGFDPGRRELDRRVARRAEVMISWHLMLLGRFAGTEDEFLLDRLAGHPALGGPEQTYFAARLAQTRNDLPAVHQLTCQALELLPGHAGLLALARETNAPLPARASAVAAHRAHERAHE